MGHRCKHSLKVPKARLDLSPRAGLLAIFMGVMRVETPSPLEPGGQQAHSLNSSKVGLGTQKYGFRTPLIFFGFWFGSGICRVSLCGSPC